MDRRPDFDDVHVPLIDRPQLSSRIYRGTGFSILETPADTSIFDYAARFNLFTIDVSMFQAPSAVGQPLSFIYAVELSEDREIFNSDFGDDDDLLSVRQILTSLK
jgi:hypothetical protein